MRKVFRGRLLSTNQIGRIDDITRVSDAKPHGTSGGGAITTAIAGGAKRVILLGYDCQHTNGKAHWHGNHPTQLGNAQNIEMWQEGFSKIAFLHSDIQIINASRQTALKCFERKKLEDVL